MIDFLDNHFFREVALAVDLSDGYGGICPALKGASITNLRLLLPTWEHVSREVWSGITAKNGDFGDAGVAQNCHKACFV